MNPFAAIDTFLTDFRRHLIKERMLEALGWTGIVTVSSLALAVGATAVFPGTAFIRAVALSLLTGTALLLAGFTLHRARRQWSNPLHLAQIVGRRLPDTNDGLLTVVSLRPELDNARLLPLFSPALLHAQAKRTSLILSEHAPKSLVRYRRFVRLLITLGALLISVAALGAIFPWGTARGVRTLLGLSERSTPSWLAGPIIPVDVLASDLKTTLLFKLPDGGVERVPVDETGEITAPAGTTIEVSGRLTREALSVLAVVVTDEPQQEYPVSIQPDGTFQTAFPATRPGQWYLKALSVEGLRMAEEVRRPILVPEASPPHVRVDPPDRSLLSGGESVTIRYAVSSAFALAGIDMVLRFPLDPARPPTRTHIRTLPQGARYASGEIVFTMPMDAPEAGGRIDLSLEAFSRNRRDAANTGQSREIRFFADTPRFRPMARMEAIDTLLVASLQILADIREEGSDPTSPLPQASSEQLAALADQAQRMAEEARQGSAGMPGPDVQALLVAADMLAPFKSAPPATSKAAVEILVETLLRMDDFSTRERLAQMDARLTEIAREVARLKAAPALSLTDDTKVAENRKALERSLRLVRLVEEETQRLIAVWRVEGGEAERTSLAMTQSWSRARDAVLSASEGISRKGPAANGTLETAIQTLNDMVSLGRTSLGRLVREKSRTVMLPPETATLIRQMTQGQRDVMDRTAQAAFVLKTRTDTITMARGQEVGPLVAQVEEASDLLARVMTDPLDTSDTEDVARLREDLASARDLLEEHDMDMALKMIRDVTERTVRLASDLRDQAEWASEDHPQQAAAWRTASGRLARSVPPLREVVRILTAWKREKDALIGPTEKSDLRIIRLSQDDVLEKTVRAGDLFRKAVTSGSAEPVTWLQNARRNMEEAVRRLSEFNPAAAEVHQRQAIQELLKLKRVLERGIEENPTHRYSVSDEPESVRIPEPAPQRLISELGREIEAFRQATPLPAYTDLVRLYYQALLKPQ